MKPIKNIDDPRFVKAMSHPLRVRILAMLDERKASPNQLAGWLGASLGPSPTTSARSSTWASSSSWTRRVCAARSNTTTGRASAPTSPPRAGPRRRRSPSRRPSARPSTSSPSTPARRPPRAASTAGRAAPPRARPARRSKGFVQLSKACDKLLEQAEKIEAAAAERIAKDPHADDIVEAGLGLMLFDAVRLSGTLGDRRPQDRGSPHLPVASRDRQSLVVLAPARIGAPEHGHASTCRSVAIITSPG